MTDSDAAGLEARLKIVEDKLAIYELIASHPPSADTGSADYTSSVYLEDGVFDRGPTPDGATGVENIAAFTLRPAHEQAIRDGLAHFAGLPLIDLDGDRARQLQGTRPWTGTSKPLGPMPATPRDEPRRPWRWFRLRRR